MPDFANLRTLSAKTPVGSGDIDYNFSLLQQGLEQGLDTDNVKVYTYCHLGPTVFQSSAAPYNTDDVGAIPPSFHLETWPSASAWLRIPDVDAPGLNATNEARLERVYLTGYSRVGLNSKPPKVYLEFGARYVNDAGVLGNWIFGTAMGGNFVYVDLVRAPGWWCLEFTRNNDTSWKYACTDGYNPNTDAAVANGTVLAGHPLVGQKGTNRSLELYLRILSNPAGTPDYGDIDLITFSATMRYALQED